VCTVPDAFWWRVAVRLEGEFDGVGWKGVEEEGEKSEDDGGEERDWSSRRMGTGRWS